MLFGPVAAALCTMEFVSSCTCTVCHFVADMAGQWVGGCVKGAGGLSENFQICAADGDPLLTFSISLPLHQPLYMGRSLGRWSEENSGTLLICCST